MTESPMTMGTRGPHSHIRMGTRVPISYKYGDPRSQYVYNSDPTLVYAYYSVEKQANVVYEVPCTCGNVYIGEIKRCLGTRLKEHKDACARCQTDKLAIAEHARSEDHPINWRGNKILQHAIHTMELCAYSLRRWTYA